MGWVGWTWDYVRAEDVNVVLMALEARNDLLESIFGGKPSPDRPTKRMTPEAWKSFAAGHNRRYAAKRRRTTPGG